MIEDIQTIQAELAANAERQAALQAALADKQAEMKGEAVEQIRAIVAAVGLVLKDIEGIFEKPKKMRKPSAERAVRAIYRDIETGNEYKGGKLPAWLQGRMAETGMGYEQYRDAHLQRVN